MNLNKDNSNIIGIVLLFLSVCLLATGCGVMWGIGAACSGAGIMLAIFALGFFCRD